MPSFTYRMPAGFSGDVNRTHPASIEPNINDATNPVTFYGQAGLYSTTGTFRTIGTGDSAATNIDGIAVRPYPSQQETATTSYGAAAIGTASVTDAAALDVLKSGYIMVPVVGSPVKGGTVYVWYGATGSGHTQGGFEAASGASTIALPAHTCYFNGGADASGVAEIAFNV